MFRAREKRPVLYMGWKEDTFYPINVSRDTKRVPASRNPFFWRTSEDRRFPFEVQPVTSVQRTLILSRLPPFFSMKSLMYFPQAFVGNVGINLRGGDTGMAKHGLHAAQISAVFEQVGSEAVPYDMGGNLF